MAKIYAVAVGRKTGFFEDWEEVKGYVDGFKGAVYSSFSGADAYEKAQAYLDKGGKVEVEKQVLSFSMDLGKICRVFADETQKFGKNPSFRICGLVDSSKERNRVFNAWSFEEDYEELSKLDRLCYAYVHTLKEAYNLGYREFVIVYVDDCIRGWGQGWKAKTSGGKYYKECLSHLINKAGCNVHFEKYDASTQSVYKSLMKQNIALDNKSEEYQQFGFKSTL